MPSKGFMSPEHLGEYCFSRFQEAMKEGIMNHADMFNNPMLSKDVRDGLKMVYMTGFADASSSIAKMLDDIQKVNGKEE